MALYVKFECATCENENCYGHCLPTTEKICNGYKHTATNADRIRSMSDEELAEWLQGLKYSPSCDSRCHDDFDKYGEQRTYCMDCWLDWLRQEAGEGE